MEKEALLFKKKQEQDLQAFMKKQKEEASGFQCNQANTWNDLKERHTQVCRIIEFLLITNRSPTQETWKLFGRAAGSRPDSSRPTIHNMWGEQQKKQQDSRHSSPCFSPKPASETSDSWSSMNSQVTSPTPWPVQNNWEQINGAMSNMDINGGARPSCKPSNPGDYWNR